MSKFQIIYADPPWSYRDSASAGKRGAVHKYPCMKMPELQALTAEVDNHTAENSALFLWATAPMMKEAFQLMTYWQFEFKTFAFVWVKTNRNQQPGQPVKSFFGMGNWTRANAEYVLLGIRGKIKRQSASVRQIVFSPIREHSRKPDCIREKIVELMGDLPRIELFARHRAPGWEAWGNQVEGSFKL